MIPDIEGEAVAIRADGAFTPLGGKESITEPEPLGFGRHSHLLYGRNFDDVRPL
jgi:hypothetical protein